MTNEIADKRQNIEGYAASVWVSFRYENASGWRQGCAIASRLCASKGLSPGAMSKCEWNAASVQ